jgi:DNA-binding transcriptional LysR family regulator
MREIQLHKIDLNLLSTFEALMEDGSVAGAAENLHVTPSAVSHALGRLRTQFDDPLFVRVGGKMQPTAKAVQLADDLVPVLRGLRRALKPQDAFDPSTSNRVFRIALHSSPAFMAQTTRTIQEVAPNVMIEWVRIMRINQTDLADGLIDLLHVGGPSHLGDGIQSVDVQPVTFFSYVRQGHPAALDWSLKMAKRYRYLQVAVEDHHGSTPIEKEHRDLAPAPDLGRQGARFSACRPDARRNGFHRDTAQFCNGRDAEAI